MYVYSDRTIIDDERKTKNDEDDNDTNRLHNATTTVPRRPADCLRRAELDARARTPYAPFAAKRARTHAHCIATVHRFVWFTTTYNTSYTIIILYYTRAVRVFIVIYICILLLSLGREYFDAQKKKVIKLWKKNIYRLNKFNNFNV